MARLQRKKARSAKRKASGKKSTAPAADKAVAAGKPAAISGSAKDLVKRSPLGLRKSSAVTKSVPGKAHKNNLSMTAQFLREVKVELKKVTWPSRKQTLGSTAVVLVLVLLVSLFLGLVDLGLSNIVRLVLQ